MRQSAMPHIQCLLSVIALQLLWFVPGSAETFYVTPTCLERGTSCMTLSWYATQPDNYFTSNTTLILQAGNHSLNSELMITNTTHLTISASVPDKTVVTCSQSAGFIFKRIGHVIISGITFFKCMNIITSVDHLAIEDCKFDGQQHKGTGPELEMELISNATIFNCSFSNNNGSRMIGYDSYDPNQKMPVMGGGAIVVINSKVFIVHCVISGNIVNSVPNDDVHNKGGAVYALSSDVHIDNCKFINNTCTASGGSGGAVYVGVNDTEKVSVTVVKTAFINNTSTGGDGGAVWVGDNTAIVIDNSTFINNTAGGFGGAVRVSDGTSVTIDRSTFTNNTSADSGGAVYMCSGVITIDNSMFINNTSCYGNSAVFVVITTYNTIFTMDINTSSAFVDNTSTTDSGTSGVMLVIDNSTFINNTSINGGSAVYMILGDSTRQSVTIKYCTFINNTSTDDGGGAVYMWAGDRTSIKIHSSTFINNTSTGTDGQSDGGAMIVISSISVVIDNSTFTNNAADDDGGAVLVYNSTSVTMDDCTFINNMSVERGGAVLIASEYTTTVGIHNCTFINNTANSDGGGIHIIQFIVPNSIKGLSRLSANLTNITLTHNSANNGAAIYIDNCDVSSNGYFNIDSNVAGISGVVYAVQSSVSLSGDTTVLNNTGSVFAFNSNMTLSENITFMNNSCTRCSRSGFQESGAVTSVQSNIHFHDFVKMLCNEADNGGAILALESKVHMYGNITIADNKARQSGGGIYAFQTELIIAHGVTISGNRAGNRGGGVYAISSTIKVLQFSLHFISNYAERVGGGVCLELNAKLYIVKSQCEAIECVIYGNDCSCNVNPNTWPKVVFTDNSAGYGGAVYVTDDTNSASCFASPSIEQTTASQCFFQVLALYTFFNNQNHLEIARILNLISLNFTNNTARVAGGTLFGGLLDRCTVSPFAEIFQKYYDQSPNSVNNNSSLSYFLNVTNLKRSELTVSNVSSNPVRVCYCKDDKPDCNYQPPIKRVIKGSLFTVSLVAVDQINNTIPNSTIHSSLSSGDGRLSEGQAIQHTNKYCTELKFNAFSPHNHETLLLYAEGPCNNTGISARHFEVYFDHCQCPIGFKPANKSTECDCECDPALSLYTTDCFIDKQTILREGDFWLTYVNANSNVNNGLNGGDNDEAGFIIKPHCPFDYCHEPSEQVYINFNILNGADAQCALNHTGILCGSCGENLSLALGSSRCISCSNDWLALLFLFVIAGVALVAFLLVFNLTIAVGTINGVIFYANIIVANRATFLPFDRSNLLTVFIAWLNLDFGFEACFYDGMDGYAKVWLQLVFPCYIMLLIAMIIVVCEYSHRFSRLISYTNSVATLATLILLSYAKLLRTIIASLSFTTLWYPNGSHEIRWLYDANVPYLKGKHIPLFVAALLILLVGIVYTFLLIFWQIILWVLDKFHIKWPGLHIEITTVRRWYVGLQNFMDVYYAPYNTSHRYWTGLLLLLRGVLYLISAVNVFGDPSVNLLSILCAVSFLLMWKLVAHKIYKTEYLNNLDTLFLMNLNIFTSGTLYLRAASAGSGNQAALAYTSISIAFITFLGILCYHTKEMYLYRLVKRKIQQYNDSHHISIRAEESATVKERRQLEPLSPTYSVSSFDGLPDPDQESYIR